MSWIMFLSYGPAFPSLPRPSGPCRPLGAGGGGGRGETRSREGWLQAADALRRGTGGGTARRRNFRLVEL